MIEVFCFQNIHEARNINAEVRGSRLAKSGDFSSLGGAIELTGNAIVPVGENVRTNSLGESVRRQVMLERKPV